MKTVPVRDGSKLRVKRTPILREFGIRCYSPLNADDCKIWPGEIGTVVVYRGNGWNGMKLCFDRGRTKQIGTEYDSEPGVWHIDDDELLSCFSLVKG